MTENPSDPNYTEWTDDDLDAFASVNDATLADAQADARRADDELASFLESDEVDD